MTRDCTPEYFETAERQEPVIGHGGSEWGPPRFFYARNLSESLFDKKYRILLAP